MEGNVKPIWHVFDGQAKNLHIPVYQRNYDWQESQCERLFDDLEEIIEVGRKKHFFGAVVGDPETSFTWVVIDGQQRLTTVSILILALVHAARDCEVELDDPDLPDMLEQSYLLSHSRDRSKVKVKLKPIKDDAEAYGQLFKGTNLVQASNVTANYLYFRKRLAASDLTCTQVWDAIRRLEVMILDLTEGDQPQRIFETLNSTGLALSEADKIRNFVLMDLNTSVQEEMYEDHWNPMEKAVDYETDWFIRWYLVTMTTRTPRQDEVYEAFKKYLRSSGRDVQELLADMHEFSRYARELTHAQTGDTDLDRALARYSALASDVILPFLLPVVRDWHQGVINTQDLIRIIEILESYLMRRTVCGMWSNALNKIFANAYTELRRLRTADQRYSEILIYMLRRRDDSSGRFPDDDEFRRELETRNIYRLKTENRNYLFECLENLDSKDTRDIASRLQSGELSIEHIMPQTLTNAWRTALGPEAEEIHSTWLNRLGNLTVTGYNSEYSNSPFTEKLTAERGFQDSPYRLNTYVKEQTEWGAEQIATRTKALADAAVEFWPYATTDFAPPAITLPVEPMGTDKSFTNRDIVSFEIGDLKVTVQSWAEALPLIVRHLAKTHRSRIIAHVPDMPMLSIEPDHANGSDPAWVPIDAGLAVRRWSSTAERMRGLRLLFRVLDLDPDSLVFTLRPVKGDAAEGHRADHDGDTAPTRSAYADLIKFLPRFGELKCSAAGVTDTAELRTEFAAAFTAFAIEDPQTALAMPYPSVTADAIQEMMAAQVLAYVQVTLDVDRQFMPGTLHAAILDGRISAALERLAAI